MNWAALIALSADQAASSTSVFGVMLQNLAAPQRRQNFIQMDFLFDHLLLRMLCNPEGPGSRMGFDAGQRALEFGSVKLLHSGQA